MHGSSCDVLQPKYGGKIIDIVSRDVRRPEDKAQALEDVKGTILYIVTIVLVGYLFLSEKSTLRNHQRCSVLKLYKLLFVYFFTGSSYAAILLCTN
jgi:hypothetical protein